MINRLVFPIVLLILSLGGFAQDVSPPSMASNQTASAQQQLAPPTSVKLTVRAMVIDRDLNVKPIPKFVFNLELVTDQVANPKSKFLLPSSMEQSRYR
jgi:hypothetical protein